MKNLLCKYNDQNCRGCVTLNDVLDKEVRCGVLFGVFLSVILITFFVIAWKATDEKMKLSMAQDCFVVEDMSGELSQICHE